MSASVFQLIIRVTPHAPRSEFTGWSRDEQARPILLIRLKAPPMDGKANAELLRFLSERLHCPKSAIRLMRGATGRQKAVELPQECRAHLPPQS